MVLLLAIGGKARRAGRGLMGGVAALLLLLLLCCCGRTTDGWNGRRGVEAVDGGVRAVRVGGVARVKRRVARSVEGVGHVARRRKRKTSVVVVVALVTHRRVVRSLKGVGHVAWMRRRKTSLMVVVTWVKPRWLGLRGRIT